MAKEDFLKHIKESAQRFKSIAVDSHIKVVSHLDTDGITAASILIDILNKRKQHYSITILPQLNRKRIKEITAESFDVIVFTDLGSSQLDIISENFRDKQVFILDHHAPKDSSREENITHVNPHLFGLASPKEISGAGVVYLFAKELRKDADSLSHLAVIGAVGDNQEDNGFIGLNADILKNAEKSGKIRVERSLRLFGSQTKPLYRILKESFNMFIPQVTGSETGSIEFLKSLGIEPRIKGKWTKMVHLTASQKERLVEGIIERRDRNENPKDIVGNVYILPLENEGAFRDAREFSTVLNACGRLGKASVGIGACLNDTTMKIKAEGLLNSYRKEIISSLQWFDKNKDSKDVVRQDGFMIINLKDNILPTMIGTLGSILAFSNDFLPDTIILTMGYLDKRSIKLSLRIVGKKNRNNVDLKVLAGKIAAGTGGESGGHKTAAGAIISMSKESEIIDCAKAILRTVALEERIH